MIPSNKEIKTYKLTYSSSFSEDNSVSGNNIIKSGNVVTINGYITPTGTNLSSGRNYDLADIPAEYMPNYKPLFYIRGNNQVYVQPDTNKLRLWCESSMNAGDIINFNLTYIINNG